MQNHLPTLYLGSFNSERYWRETQLSKLPTIADSQADAIVSVMDELGFVFCNSSNDVLITRFPINDTHQQYLRALGFSFLNNQSSLIEDSLEVRKSVEELLLETKNHKSFQPLVSSVSGVSPYSILPATERFCQHYHLPASHPKIEIVRQVNSKLFSHQLGKRLFADTIGEIIYSASELEAKGNQLLETSAFLVKDGFGVSGKGNIQIDSPPVLQRIVKYIAKQEKKGQKTEFLLEPFLDKQIDFSCQFEIQSTGEIQIKSIQRMQNAGFAFSGIQTAESAFQEKLEQIGYFDRVEAIARELYRTGYFGPVCLDSMLLKDGKIIPVVEINARKSMGLINYYLDRFLSHFSVRGCLAFFSLGLSRSIAVREIIDRMKQENILFLLDRPTGILPLSFNTLNINYQLDNLDNPKLEPNKNDKIYKGRIYASIISNSEEDKTLILQKMSKIFTDLNIKQFN